MSMFGRTVYNQIMQRKEIINFHHTYENGGMRVDVEEVRNALSRVENTPETFVDFGYVKEFFKEVLKETSLSVLNIRPIEQNIEPTPKLPYFKEEIPWVMFKGGRYQDKWVHALKVEIPSIYPTFLRYEMGECRFDECNYPVFPRVFNTLYDVFVHHRDKITAEERFKLKVWLNTCFGIISNNSPREVGEKDVYGGISLRFAKDMVNVVKEHANALIGEIIYLYGRKAIYIDTDTIYFDIDGETLRTEELPSFVEAEEIHFKAHKRKDFTFERI